MDLSKLTGDVDAIPETLKPILAGLLEGRIKQLVVIAEMDDGCIMDCFPVFDSDANRYVMVGALEVMKRDYMREQVQARIQYAIADEED